MRLNRLLLENFGLYRGAHEIHLANRKRYGAQRPIILFGGMNGEGKTTLLDAVQLALYGKSALGASVRQVDYEAYLRSRIHRARRARKQPTGAAVGLEFEFFTMGSKKVYQVRRSWTAHPTRETGVKEELEVLCDGAPLEEVDPQHWQDFIRELVPPGLSQLFFFDGEKIQKLAEEDDQSLLAESIQALLGLDVVERLQADLKIFSDRELKNYGSDKLVKELREVEGEMEELRGQERLHAQDLEELGQELRSAQKAAQEAEDHLTRLGGRFAENRTELQKSRSANFAEVETLKKQIREMAEGLLPFSFCPGLNARLLQQMEQEALAVRQRMFRDSSSGVIERVAARLGSNGKGGDRGRDAMAKEVLALLREEFARELPSAEHQPIHEYSEGAHRRLQSWFDQATGEVSAELVKLVRSLESATRELQDSERLLQQIPQDDALAPAVVEVMNAARRLGELEEREARLKETLQGVRGQLDQASRRQERVREKLKEKAGHSERLVVLQRSTQVLERYRERLLEWKTKAVEHEVTECLRQLMRKEDLIRRVSICPKTFAITLYDHARNPIDKSLLAAGEKQMYAIAILWGIGRTAGRPLPMIIDTPLGRLDSMHRANLVEHYFPRASHQVIILSTDQEVDSGFYEALNRNISHAFRLQYDEETGCTTPREGYFWRAEVEA